MRQTPQKVTTRSLRHVARATLLTALVAAMALPTGNASAATAAQRLSTSGLTGSVQIAAAPLGSLELAAPAGAGKIRLKGWVYNPDLPGSMLSVKVFAGGPSASGRQIYAGLAGLYRSDLGVASGYHGFDVTVPMPVGYTAQVFAYGINVPGSPNGLLSGSPRSVTTQVTPSWAPEAETYATHVAATAITGGWEIFQVGRSGQIYRKIFKGTTTSGWTKVPNAFGRRVAAMTSGDGRAELFFIDLNGSIQHRWETTPGGNMDSAESLPADARELAVTAGPGGNWRAYHIGQTGGVIYEARLENKNWIRVAEGAIDLAAAKGVNGRVELFYTDASKQVQRRTETTTPRVFGAATNLGGQAASLSATSSGNGGWEVYALRTDGQLTRYAPSAQVRQWQSLVGGGIKVAATRLNDGRVSVLVIDGANVIYRAAQTWPGCFSSLVCAANDLFPGQSLNSSRELVSPDGRYRLTLQGGRLVLLAPSGVIWGPSSVGAITFRFETSGELALLGDLALLWSSRTNGTAANRLALQIDGNLVLYRTNTAVWATNTAGRT